MPHTPQTVLVTGATGLIGSFIARRLVSAGYSVRALRRPTSDLTLLHEAKDQVDWRDGDILDVPGLQQAAHGCDAVIHAAAQVSFSGRDTDVLYQVNVEGTANVVNTCLYLNTPRLVHISSVAALGQPAPGQPLNEDAKWTGEGFITHYARSKYMAEQEVWRGQAEGLSVSILNPSVVLGPGFTRRGGSTSLFNWVRDGKKFVTKGWLNYVDVRDVALAAEQALTAWHDRRYVLSAGTIPFDQFFASIAKQMGKPAPSWHLPRPWAEVGWRLEKIRSLFTGTPPLITRETARNAYRQTKIDGSLITREQPLIYTPLDQTLAYTLHQLQAQNYV